MVKSSRSSQHVSNITNAAAATATISSGTSAVENESSSTCRSSKCIKSKTSNKFPIAINNNQKLSTSSPYPYPHPYSNSYTTTTAQTRNSPRELSSLSTIKNHNNHNPTNNPINSVSNLINHSNNNSNNNNNNSSKKDNNEVMELIQSLQNIVQLQQTLGMNAHDKFNQDHANGNNAHVDNGNNVNVNHVKRKNFTLWKSTLDDAIQKRDKVKAIQIFQSKTSPFYTPTRQQQQQQRRQRKQHQYQQQQQQQQQHSKIIDTQIFYGHEVPMFHTLRKLMNMYIPAQLEVAFEIFQKSEDLYIQIEDELDNHPPPSNDSNDKYNDNHSSTCFQQIQKVRAHILSNMVAAIGMSVPSSSKSSTSKPSSMPLTNYQYILTELSSTLHCIQDPLLQHELYPKFIRSLMRSKRFKYANIVKHIEYEFWDIVLDSLSHDLSMISEAEAQQAYAQARAQSQIEEKSHDNFVNDNDTTKNVDCEEENSNKDGGNYSLKEQFRPILKEYETLLELSTYRRQEHLQFVDKLKVLVTNGATPRPEIVLNIIQNEYPYSNANNVYSLLQSLIHLQRHKKPTQLDYIVDLGTLQHLTVSPAKRGNTRAVSLLWKYMDLIRTSLETEEYVTSSSTSSSSSIDSSSSCITSTYYKPTEAIYENAAEAFSSSTKQGEDEMVFRIFAEMERDGMKPSRAFLNRVSESMRTRSSVKRLNKAMYILRSSYNDGWSSSSHTYPTASGGDGGGDTSAAAAALKPTTSSLNCVLAGYADLGYLDKAFRTFDEYRQLGCEPDEQTFGILMDACAMNVITAIPPNVQNPSENVDGNDNANGNRMDDFTCSWIESQVEIADAILETAKEMGFVCDHHFVHTYVKILCTVDELDKAMRYVEETLDEGRKVSQETFGLIAIGYARKGDMETVNYVINMTKKAGYKNGLLRLFMERIERLKG